MRKIILLGASGFLGKALSSELQGNDELELFGYSSREINLLKKQDLARLDSIINSQTVLVLLSGITRDRGDGPEAAQKNILMVKNVAEYLQRRPVQRCLYLSSSAVYGNISHDSIDEQTKAQPETPYARSKLEGELLLQQLAQTRPIELVILRPVAIFGPGDTHKAYGVTGFLRSLLTQNRVTLYGDGTDSRDHLYIRDFAQLTRQFILGNFTGLYNLAVGRSYSFIEILQLIREVSSPSFQLDFKPRPIPLVHQRFNTEKLTRAIGHFPWTDFKESLSLTYQSLKKKRNCSSV